MHKNLNGALPQSQSIENVLSSSFLIDETEFQRAATLHATADLYSRLGLHERFFLTFCGVLAYTRGSVERQRVPQGAIAATIYDLRQSSEPQRKYAIQRVGRYLTAIAEKQRIVVVQIEPGGMEANKKVWSLLTVYAWEIIHNAIEYLPVEMPDAAAQFKGMKTAMDRAIEEFMKGGSRLVGRLGKKRTPLTDEQKLRSLMRQYANLLNHAHLTGGLGEARKLQMIAWEALDEGEQDLRKWEGRRDKF